MWGLCLSQCPQQLEISMGSVSLSVRTMTRDRCGAYCGLSAHTTLAYLITVIATEMCSMEYVSKTIWSPCRCFNVFPQVFRKNSVTPPSNMLTAAFSATFHITSSIFSCFHVCTRVKGSNPALPKKLPQLVTIQNYVWEVPISDIGRTTDCPDLVFSCFSQSLQENDRRVFHIRLRMLPSSSFPIYQSLCLPSLRGLGCYSDAK
jgi:hypothetical protein